jgi:hypothetical protein
MQPSQDTKGIDDQQELALLRLQPLIRLIARQVAEETVRHPDAACVIDAAPNVERAA